MMLCRGRITSAAQHIERFHVKLYIALYVLLPWDILAAR